VSHHGSSSQITLCNFKFSLVLKVYFSVSIVSLCAWSYRVAKRPRIPYLCRSFLQKSPISGGCFAERDVQLKAPYASTPSCSVCGLCHTQCAMGRLRLVNSLK